MSEGSLMLSQPGKRIKVILLTHSIYCFVEHFLIQYNVLFAQALGASGTDIGLISLIGALVLFLTSPYIGRAVERRSMKKIMLLGLICDIVAALFFIVANDWRLLIPAFALLFILFRQIAFADMIFVTFTPPTMRATLMGLSRVLWNIMVFLASPTAALIVTYFGGINEQGIRPLYYISLIILFAIFLILYKELDDFYISDNREESKQNYSLFEDYQRLFKTESHLKYWLLIRLFRGGSMILMRVFAPLWIVNIKGATAIVLGTLSALSTICGLLIQVPVGKLADKLGRKKIFILLSTFHCIGLIILILAPTHEWLMLASILGIGVGGLEGGGVGGAANAPLMVMWWEAVPSASRGRLYGLEGMIMSTARLFTMIGGILWDLDLKVLVILIPLLTEILVVIPFVCKLPDNPKK